MVRGLSRPDQLEHLDCDISTERSNRERTPKNLLLFGDKFSGSGVCLNIEIRNKCSEER